MTRSPIYLPLWALGLMCCSCPLATADDVNAYRATGSRSALPPMYYEVGRSNVMPVSYTGGHAGPDCGADASCGSAPCCSGSFWNDPCCVSHYGRTPRRACGIFGRGGGCASARSLWSDYCHEGCDSGCHSGGCQSGCANGCYGGDHRNCNHGCDACHAYDTNGLGCDTCCSGQRWGFRGCAPCCQPCYRPHCKPIRCWANGWCGELLDGKLTGHPVCYGQAPCTNCQLGSPAGELPVVTPESAPPPMAPMTPMNAPLPTPAAPGGASEAPPSAHRQFRYSPVSNRYQRSDVIK